MKPSNNPYVRVTSRTSLEDGRALKFRLANGLVYEERPFIPMTKEDSVQYTNGSQNMAWLKLRNSNHLVQIKPAWQTTQTIRINGKKVKLTIKEIETQEELIGYRELTKFHYRGRASVGRRIPLIAKISAWNLPEVVGFVELSCSLIVNVARKNILDHPFEDPSRNVSWEKWDFDTAKKYCNALARISRCVVFPELRGLGVAAELAKAVSYFAEERWHVAGLRPCFLEITAEMLRYWPFVKKYGYVYVGETKGSQQRAPEAMRYLLQRNADNRGYPKGGGGIMNMYRGHATRLAKLNKPIDEIIDLLKKPSHELSRKNWLEIHDICRRKKPTYMFGLTPAAKKHIELWMPKTPYPSKQNTLKQQKKHEVLASVKNLRISTRIKPRDTKECRQIQEAFGIVSHTQEMNLIQNFEAEFRAGEVTMVTGASGAGKSLFLNALCHLFNKSAKKPPRGVKITGEKNVSVTNVVHLIPPPREKSPIELLRNHSLEDAMRILAQAGLAEAHLFVRPSRTLSVGQFYRLSLAVALSKKPDILLIDEFCEFLDEYTTAAICRKIRQSAESAGLCIVVATAYTNKVQPELRPNRTLLLLPNGAYQWFNKKRVKMLSS